MSFLTDPRAIEEKSLAIIRSLYRESKVRYSKPEEAVVNRIIHATGETGYAEHLRVHPKAVEAGITSLLIYKTIVTDVNMVCAGINPFYLPGLAVHCNIKAPEVRRLASEQGITRSMAAIRSLGQKLTGAVVAIGNAPTALYEVLRLSREYSWLPAVIIGMPVGFVGAAEAKEELMASSIPYITVPGTRGGSSAAAAAANALLLLARDREGGNWAGQ